MQTCVLAVASDARWGIRYKMEAQMCFASEAHGDTSMWGVAHGATSMEPQVCIHHGGTDACNCVHATFIVL